MTIVLDASALIAMMLDEPGGTAVRSRLDDAVLNTVNLSEVLSYFVERGGDARAIAASIEHLPIQVVLFDDSIAIEAARLRGSTRRFGLSLGDRACLATAIARGCPVATADRAWTKVDIGVEVELIR